MPPRSIAPRLADIGEAIEVVWSETARVSLESFEADRKKRWLVERELEIISEASRHLTEELKSRHPNIPWRRIAGIGNVLRHDYGRIAPDILWRLAQDDLQELDKVCRGELERERASEAGGVP